MYFRELSKKEMLERFPEPMTNDWSNWQQPKSDWIQTQSVTFKLDDQEYTVDCYPVDNLGVILNQDPCSIIHLPTLTMFDKAIPTGEYSDQELIDWATKVQQENKEHWNKLKTVDVEWNWLDDGDIISRATILAYCRGIKVGD